jgi:glycine cleavage system H protein
MKNEEFFEYVFDKFKLRVPKGYWYAGYDTWAFIEGNTAKVGITDFLQTKLGDILFFEPVQTQQFEQDDILGILESIKATIELTMPVSGKLIEFNPKLAERSELLSEDPYGEGWIAKVELSDWEADKAMLLPPEKYFEVMQEKAKNALLK